MRSSWKISRYVLYLAVAVQLPGTMAEGALLVHSAPVPPVVDGIIEEVWHESDSVVTFFQLRPTEGAPVSEPTVVYALQTSDGLFFAMRCMTNGRPPDCRPGYRDSREGDYVSVDLDTFHDRRNAYRFIVNCAGVQADEIVSEDGRESNSDWDGVFRSAAAHDSLGYSVEIMIPWSTLRYRRRDDTWGVNFARAIPVNGELAYSSSVRLNEGLRVSGFDALVGLKPKARPRGIEFYPQGLFRAEKSYGDRTEILKPAADANWAFTPSWRLQATVNPDFSQVEADPFALNLSKYSIYFREKRPFFVEGQEYFRPSGGPIADMLQVFYSRQVGMRLPDGTEVPILAGLRSTAKWRGEEISALAAMTGSEDYTGFLGPDREPRALFGVARWNHQIAPLFTVAAMTVGKFSDSSDQVVASLDATASTARSQFTGQVARSSSNGNSDWAMKTFFRYRPRTWFVSGYATMIGDHFNVSEIGFVPWRGLRRYSLSAGPVLIKDSGVIGYGSAKVGALLSRESGEERYSNSYLASIETSLRNNWGATVGVQLGREYEFAGSYNPRALTTSVSSDPTRRAWFVLSYYTVHEYNYARGFFGRSDYGNWYTSWRFSRILSAYFDGSTWIERGPGGRVVEVTWRFRPGAGYAITKGMNTRFFAEIPVTKSDAVLSLRLGWSYSYNFADKSWIYLAFNDFQRRQEGGYRPLQRVVVLKIKYLFSA